VENKIVFYMKEVNEAIQGKAISPITCEIDPSNYCNLNCNFCMYAKYIKNNREHLDLKTFINLIYELKVIGVKSITFTGGGEPLMNPSFNEMASRAHSLGFQLGLITNGTLLNKVKNLDHFEFIRISLDSYDKNSYLKIKGVDLFDKVLDNIMYVLAISSTDVGISYVICEENVDGIKKAQEISDNLGVKYIQFKPAWINGKKIKIPDSIENSTRTVITDRYNAEDNLPCLIAGLIGIVGADSNVYFCCQHRGKENFSLGNLKDSSFIDLWKKRIELVPSLSKCPSCRYMNYAVGYKTFSQPQYVFLNHINFL